MWKTLKGKTMVRISSQYNVVAILNYKGSLPKRENAHYRWTHCPLRKKERREEWLTARL